MYDPVLKISTTVVNQDTWHQSFLCGKLLDLRGKTTAEAIKILPLLSNWGDNFFFSIDH
jgi:hypothetical protein